MAGLRKRDLTEGQKQCLRMVVAHKTSKEIARKLGISHYTVDQRLDAARRKLGVKTRREAALHFARMEQGSISERFVYEATDIANGAPAGSTDAPTSDRGYVGGQSSGYIDSELQGESCDLLSTRPDVTASRGIPPIGGHYHQLRGARIARLILGIALAVSLVVATVGVAVMLLTGTGG